MIRVVLPYHLRTLAHVGAEVTLHVDPPVTPGSILDALEAQYPMLCGTIRDHLTRQRRPMLRFFACEQDLSHEPIDSPLPAAVAAGTEPFWIVGAIAGGAYEDGRDPPNQYDQQSMESRSILSVQTDSRLFAIPASST